MFIILILMIETIGYLLGIHLIIHVGIRLILLVVQGLITIGAWIYLENRVIFKNMVVWFCIIIIFHFLFAGDVAWRHYSVSGKPCRRSSPCEKNLITGFYSCEIEGGEVGSWDYCCKVDHPCGYSQGFDYPW